MKKITYLFLIILTTFMSVTFVDAEKKVKDLTLTDVTPLSTSCSNNLLKMELADTVVISANYIYVYDPGELERYPTSTNVANKYLVEVQENTNYYFYTSGSTTFQFYYLKESLSIISQQSIWNGKSFTTPANTKYILLISDKNYTEFKTSIENDKFMLSQSDTKLDYVDYLDCSAVPEEPDVPEEPIIIPDSTLDNFYSLFLDKLKALSSFALENKFVLSAIGIVLVLTCLELFIYLFKGGKWR